MANKKEEIKEAEVVEAEVVKAEEKAKEAEKTEEKVEEKTEKTEKAEKVEQAEETEKAEKAEKTEKAEKAEKVEKVAAKREEPKKAPREKKPMNLAAVAVGISCAAMVLSGTSAVFSYLAYDKASTPITILNGGGVDGNTASFVEGTVADVVEKVSESVVSIVTSATATSYFGQNYTSSAAGTGIIVTSDGYILTNKHVIDGATKISVVLDNGKTYDDVEVAAVDPLNDVAFLKIKDVSGLTAVTLGDSKTISVGQQVIAIGNALGQYQNSVTSGIISGTGRSLTATDSSGTMSERLSDMIQTDAAINSGNSGGPLVNAAGQVIGINTATSSSADNVGFAIPISSVKGMLQQLIEEGEAKRAYLGVYLVDITSDTAKSYILPVTQGEYVYSPSMYSAVVSGGPADKAGIKDKDIITAVNGQKVGVAGSLSSLIGEYKPGDTVQLTVIREGKEIAVNVVLDGYSEE